MKVFSARSLQTVLATVAALCCFAWPAQAVSVDITNPSFEDPTLYDYSFTNSTPGWTATGRGSVDIQRWPSLWTSGLPEGSNYLLANSGGIGSGVKQVLTTPIAASTAYTLSVWVGERDGYCPPAANFEAYLTFDNGLAVPAAIATDSPPLVDKGWVLWTRTYLVPADGIVDGENVLGKNITVNLFNTATDGSSQASFDLVALDAQLVPEPATGVLLLAGGAILAAFRSRTALTARGGRR